MEAIDPKNLLMEFIDFIVIQLQGREGCHFVIVHDRPTCEFVWSRRLRLERIVELPGGQYRLSMDK